MNASLHIPLGHTSFYENYRCYAGQAHFKLCPYVTLWGQIELCLIPWFIKLQYVTLTPFETNLIVFQNFGKSQLLRTDKFTILLPKHNNGLFLFTYIDPSIVYMPIFIW